MMHHSFGYDSNCNFETNSQYTQERIILYEKLISSSNEFSDFPHVTHDVTCAKERCRP